MSRLKELRRQDKPVVVFVRSFLITMCGKVCMYDLQEYREDELTLHHDPPFRDTECTKVCQSYIISKVNHAYLNELEQEGDIEAYNVAMKKIRQNKQLLLFKNLCRKD